MAKVCMNGHVMKQSVIGACLSVVCLHTSDTSMKLPSRISEGKLSEICYYSRYYRDIMQLVYDTAGR